VLDQVKASFPSFRDHVNKGARGVQLGQRSYRWNMATTGNAVSAELASVIVTPFRKGSILVFGRVRGNRSSSDWMYLRVRLHCTNAVWPLAKSFCGQVISPGRRMLVWPRQKVPYRFASRGSFLSSSESTQIRRLRVIGSCSFCSVFL
jgi:hypothetical protein